jgi:hypothetical protein
VDDSPLDALARVVATRNRSRRAGVRLAVAAAVGLLPKAGGARRRVGRGHVSRRRPAVPALRAVLSRRAVPRRAVPMPLQVQADRRALRAEMR